MTQNFTESFNSYLTHLFDDIYMLSSQATQLRTPIISERKFYLDKFEDKLTSLLETIRKLQSLNQ